jgi:anti-sigma28 factor (negative regulator of flagellin synthesis)
VGLAERLLPATVMNISPSCRLLFKESKMSILSRRKDESAAIIENTEIPLSEGTGNKDRERMTAPTLQNSPSLPKVREKKVFAIKQQLAESTYELDKRLDAVLERLLVAVTK